MEISGIDELWNLHDAYTVQQAAALVAGFDPNTVQWNMNGGAWFENEHGLTESGGINRVTTAFTALVNAINGRTLTATVRREAWERGWNEGDDGFDDGENFQKTVAFDDADAWPIESKNRVRHSGIVFKVHPTWHITTMTKTDLVSWLYSRGMRTGFFFPDANPDTPGYLDPQNPRYAPKLAAAVSAWEAVTEPGKKSPKQALDKWLRNTLQTLG